MTNFHYYENKQNKILILERSFPIFFSHVWNSYNLESLRYFAKTNIELIDYTVLYTQVCKFLDSLRTQYTVENWVIKLKGKRFLEMKPINKFKHKKNRLRKNRAFKMANTNTNVIYTVLEFQKQIALNSTIIGITPKFDWNKDLTNLNSKNFLKLQLNNEKI